MNLFSKTVLILGAGRSGMAAHALLVMHGIKTKIYDDNIKNYNSEIFIHDISLVILSPGIDRKHFLVKKALLENIPILNERDLATLFLKECKIIGITGTNGKSTTTVMLESILKTAGLNAIACGNLGIPLCEIALQNNFDYLIIELSSFQLE